MYKNATKYKDRQTQKTHIMYVKKKKISEQTNKRNRERNNQNK